MIAKRREEKCMSANQRSIRVARRDMDLPEV